MLESSTIGEGFHDMIGRIVRSCEIRANA